MNEKEIFAAIKRELTFIKENPDMAHDLRVDSAERAMELLNKLQALIQDK
jgi:hypothetical protein